MKKSLAWIPVVAVLLMTTGCGADLRYGKQINSQNEQDASLTQSMVIQDVIREANGIQGLLANDQGNVYLKSELTSTLSKDITDTQNDMDKLQAYRQPDSWTPKFKDTFNALSGYKSSLQYLEQDVQTKGQPTPDDIKQFHAALRVLESTYVVKP